VSPRDFDELIDAGDLSEDERRRLEEVHELLVAAGPPPDLPAALTEPPRLEPGLAPVVPLAERRRGRGTWAALAAALALAAFAGGYALGVGRDDGDVVRVVALEGAGGARAEVSLGEMEPGGNWPMTLEVSGLPRQTADRAYYELFVWRDGEPRYPCVGFKMDDGTTTVEFTVPYELREDTELVVTEVVPGKIRWPGNVVMRTV
jgi:hypothetical protein